MPFRVTLPLVLLLAFAAVGLVAGRHAAVGNPEVIKIVSSLPRSGSARAQTDTIVRGIRLAIDDVGRQITVTDPATGQPRTFRLDYLDLDDATAAEGQWTIEQEIANANQARMDPDSMVYIGTYNSGAAKVSMPILNRAGMLMISPANTSPGLTKPGTGERHEPGCYRPSGEVNYTRVVPTDDVQGVMAARWCLKEGKKKVYILDDNEVYGKGIADIFRLTCEQIGLTVLGQQSIDSKSQEFTPLMTTIRRLQPDLIYFGGTTQTKAGQLFKDMVQAGMTCPMLGPDGCYEQVMVENAGATALQKASFYATYGGLPIEELKEGRGKEFVERYAAKYGAPPGEAYATYGYECGLAALEAIKRAGVKDRDAIRRAGLAIKDFEGATGRWSIDANGDTTNKTMSMNKVEVDPDPSKSRFRFVEKLVGPDAAK